MRTFPIAAATALAALLIPAGEAAAAKVRWVGLFYVDAVSAKCPSDYVGKTWQAKFRPSGLGDNGPTTAISLFHPNGALNWRGKGRIGAAWKKVASYSIYDTENDIGPVRMRFTEQSPSTLKASTRFITIRGQVEDFDEYAGCTVTFSMPLTKRLEK